MATDPIGSAGAGLWRSPAVRAGLSVGLATGAYGLSFGALSVAQGLTIAQTCALSVLMFTGGSQFAFIGVLGSSGGGMAATATAALLGFRNALYSLQVVPMLAAARDEPASTPTAGRGHRLAHHAIRHARNVLAAHVTIDESAAVGFAQRDPRERSRGFWATGLAVFVFWNIFTFVGAWLGDILDDPRTYGLDGAAAAAFLALLWPRLTSTVARSTAVGAAAVAALTLPLLGTGLAVLAAAAFAAGVALMSSPPTLAGTVAASNADTAPEATTAASPGPEPEAER